MKVHIFTKEGSTFTFLNVSDFSINESMVTFTFTAQSDGTVKSALFFVKSIAGFTKTKTEEGPF